MKALYFLPLFLYACGSDTPSFIEKPEGIISFGVNDSATSAEDDSETVTFSGETDEDALEYAASEDAVAQDSASAPDSAESVDQQTVIKACGPHLRNFAQKIKVVDGDSGNLNFTISSDTAIAFKIAGNQTKLNIQLPAGNDIPGLCFFVTGNKASVTFSGASAVSSLVYIGRGNQSAGSLSFLGGSPVQARIDLKGNGPTLAIKGMAPELCAAQKVSCNP